MSTYVVPQVKVFQDFTSVAAEIVEPLRAFIFGPHYKLVRFAQASEKEDGSLGAYNPLAAYTDYPWPNKPTGAKVDLGFTKVYAEDAYLQFFSDSVGAGDTIINVENTKNRIHFAATNLVNFTNPITGTAYARDTDLLRDVQVGDIAKVSRGATTVTATIIGFDYEETLSALGATSDDPNNASTQIFSSTFSQTGGPTSLVRMEWAFGDLYDGLNAGKISETYTIEVIQASVDGDATTAVLRVTSASGTDDNLAYTPDAGFDQQMSIGTRGLTAIFTNGAGSSYGYGAGGGDFIVGQKWQIAVNQAYTAPTGTFGGTFTGPSDTTYIAEVTKGGAAGVAQVTISTTTGIDSSGPHTISSTGSFSIGRYGLTFAINSTTLRKGDRFYAAATASTDGAVRTLVLSSNLPDGLLYTDGGAGDDLSVVLYMKRTVEVPECVSGVTQWVASANSIRVNVDPYAYDAEWVDSNGDQVALPIKQGTLYVNYRAALTTFTEEVGSIDSIADVVTTLGTPDPDNPLALGVYKALQNSNGRDVRFMGTKTDDLTGYSYVISKIEDRVDIYSLVPLSFDTEVLDAVKAHVLAVSTPETGRWRTAWFGAQDAEDKQIGSYLATVSEMPGETDGVYIYVEASEGTFQDDGVQAGDMLRIHYLTDACGEVTYDEYEIEEVLNNQSLVLVSGPTSGIGVESQAKVWRTLSATARATEIATQASRYSDRRVRLVWPDKGSNGGVELASYFMAAALAGLRSGVVPQQSLTNVEVAGWDDVRFKLFNASQLNTMAGAGVWIVTQDPNDGTIYSRHQVTTGDTAVITSREDSLVANVDSISYFFLNRLKPFIGQANLTEQTLALIRTQIDSLIQYLTQNGVSETVGGQLISGEITELAADPVFKDKVNITVTLVVPFPVNSIDLHLIV